MWEIVEKLHIKLLIRQGDAKLASRDYLGAIQAYDQVIAAGEKNPLIFTRRGNVKFILNDFSGAFADFEQALVIDPTFVEAIYARGYLRYEVLDNENAIQDFTKVIALNPMHINAYIGRARTYENMGLFSKVLVDCDQAIMLDPEAFQAFALRGRIQMRYNIERGIIDLNRAVSLNPSDWLSFMNLSHAKRALKNEQEAIRDYEHALTLELSDPGALVKRSMNHAEYQRYEEALIDVNKAITLSPQEVGAWCQRADVNNKLGRLPEAISDFDQAIALNPNDVLAYTSRGMIKVTLKQMDEAIADFDRALILVKSSPLEEQFLNRLLLFSVMPPYAAGDYERAIERLDLVDKEKLSAAMSYAFYYIKIHSYYGYSIKKLSDWKETFLSSERKIERERLEETVNVQPIDSYLMPAVDSLTSPLPSMQQIEGSTDSTSANTSLLFNPLMLASGLVLVIFFFILIRQRFFTSFPRNRNRSSDIQPEQHSGASTATVVATNAASSPNTLALNSRGRRGRQATQRALPSYSSNSQSLWGRNNRHSGDIINLVDNQDDDIIDLTRDKGY